MKLITVTERAHYALLRMRERRGENAASRHKDGTFGIKVDDEVFATLLKYAVLHQVTISQAIVEICVAAEKGDANAPDRKA